MNAFISTPSIIIVSILAYLVATIFITRYIINGGKNEKDIIAQNKKHSKKKKSFLKKYPEADIQTARNFALAFGFIFAFAGSIFAFSVLGIAQKPFVLSPNEIAHQGITSIIPPIRTQQKQAVKNVPPPPPPVTKTTTGAIVTKPIVDLIAAKTPAPVDRNTSNVIPKNSRDIELVEAKIVNSAEKMPRFLGCENLSEAEANQCTMLKIQQYIAGIDYPKDAFKNEIEGKVYVSFIINSDGELGDVAIAKGADKSLDKESIRHLKNMPNFASGGSQGGLKVNVKYVVPIVFKLQN